MPEFPEPHLATLGDEATFCRLCMAMLEERFAAGDLVLPNRHNLNYYTEIFLDYVRGDMKGQTLMVGDFAMAMHGENPGELQMSLGRCAFLWCYYVEPRYRRRGISRLFHLAAMPRLREMGFDFTLTQTMVNNENVFQVVRRAVEGREGAGGATPYTISFWWPFGGEDEA